MQGENEKTLYKRPLECFRKGASRCAWTTKQIYIRHLTDRLLCSEEFQFFGTPRLENKGWDSRGVKIFLDKFGKLD